MGNTLEKDKINIDFDKENRYIFSHNSFKDGFVFTSFDNPKNHDAILIRNPENSISWSPRYNFSKMTLEKHIEYINKNYIEKAVIIGENIEFITNCPTLKYIEIYPADSSLNNFDYSPLYRMSEIKSLACSTQYGSSLEEKKTTIDYSKIKGLKEVLAYGEAHFNIEKNEELEVLTIKNDTIENFLHFPKKIKKLWIWESKLKSIQGIDKLTSLQDFALFYCRKIENISELSKINGNLRSLCIDHCSKIKDFSCLSQLYNLEVLELEGNNSIPNLNFLSNLKKLKFFKITMNVEDGDLSKCLNVPYVNCKNRKHYNLKNKDLPKNHDGNGFKLL